jgi:hypothetical protein
MRPIAPSDGHYPPGLVSELVPGRTTVIDEIVVAFEDAVGEPIVAHKLPDIFHRVEFGGFWRQGNDGDVGRHDEARRHVPARLIGEQHGVGAGRDGGGDFGEMQVHCLGIAGGQDQRGTLAQLRADRAEDVGRGGALIAGSARAGAALGPPACDLVLLTNAGLVLEPNLYRLNVDRFFARNFFQARGEVFLKSSIAPSAWA